MNGHPWTLACTLAAVIFILWIAWRLHVAGKRLHAITREEVDQPRRTQRHAGINRTSRGTGR